MAQAQGNMSYQGITCFYNDVTISMDIFDNLPPIIRQHMREARVMVSPESVVMILHRFPADGIARALAAIKVCERKAMEQLYTSYMQKGL